jgi:uncharacterized protein with HEPN domain
MSRDLDYAADILAAARLALSYVEGVAYGEFLDDTMRQDAVVRELLIVGEAAKRLSEEFKALHPDIPWRQMAGMRDILVHAYDHVDLDQVWRMTTDELSELIEAVEPLIQEEA